MAEARHNILDGATRGLLIRGQERFLLAAVGAWLVWVLAPPLWSGRSLSEAVPYLVSPVVLLVGVTVGRTCGVFGRRWPVAELAAVFGLGVMFVTMYANAQGEVGVQLVALVALLVLSRPPRPRSGAAGTWQLAVLALVSVFAVLLASRSQAATTLVIITALVSVWAVAGSREVARRTLVGVLGVCLGVLGASVIVLGSLPSWPKQLSANDSLSKARHQLWSDALDLWGAHPIAGGGPGSFVPSSAIAQSDSLLRWAHSSLLQVGSELGAVGVALFIAIIAAGMAVAARGSRRATLIAVTAWTCLAVHSLIDHLWEFPAVVLIAGVVVGWSASTQKDVTSPDS